MLARLAPPAALPGTDPEDDARFAARVLGRLPVPTPAPSPSPGMPSSWGLPWEAWSLRGLAAAGAMAMVMLAWNFSLLTPDNLPDDVIPPDSVAELAAAF